MKSRTDSYAAMVCSALMFAASAVWADTSSPAATASPPAAAPQPAPAPQPTAAPAPSPPTLLPAFSGSIVPDSKPTSFDAGPLGRVFVTGVVSGLAQAQNHIDAGDRNVVGDVSNAQVFINKPTGIVQFFAQAGAYSLPDLGAPYIRSSKATDDFYGPFSQWFIKLQPTDSFSIEAGKLPTLIGAEYTFSFENLNIERGLLWNQENAVNRGVQINYTKGPLALSLSWNDGMYSNKYSWAWASATYTISMADTLAVIAGGSTRHTSVSTSATPLYQNNEQIYNVIYTHTAGQWTIQPYLQYTRVPAIAAIGAFHDASTYGAALLVDYLFDAKSMLAGLSTPVRIEYIGSTGNAAEGAPNLLYGLGSKAWSITVTPTYQHNAFFARLELSYVGTSSTTPGFVFGPNGTDTSQTRVLAETGIVF